MKKRIIIILISLLGLGIIYFFLHTYFFNQQTASIQDSETENTEEKIINEKDIISMKTHVPIDKILEVEFGGALDPSTISTNNISVFDEEDQLVTVNISLTNQNKTVRIHPPSNNYKKDTKYHIVFSDEVRYKNGDDINKGKEHFFHTVRDKIEEAVLNPDLITIENDQIKEMNDQHLVVDKIKDKPIQEDDILILQTDNPNQPDGQAVKVTKMTSKRHTYELEYETPYFNELYERLDVYNTYELNVDDFNLLENDSYIDVTMAERIRPDTKLASTLSGDAAYENGAKLNMETSSPNDASTITFSIKELPIKFDDVTFTISGDINMYDPKVQSDIDIRLFETKKLELIAMAEINSKLDVKLSTKNNNDEANKLFQTENDSPKYKKEFATFLIPTPIPGLMVKGSLIFELDYNQNAEVVIGTDTEFVFERGLIYENDEVDFINESDFQTDFDLSGNAKVDASSGLGLYAGVTAFTVVGAGVEAVGGYEIEGEVTAGTSTITDGNYGCFSYDHGLFLDGSVKVGLEGLIKKLKDLSLEYTFLTESIPFDSYSNCDQFIEFIVDEEDVSLEPTEAYALEIQAEYVDLLTMDTSKEKLEKGDVSIELSNEDVIEAFFDSNKSVIRMRALENPKDNQVDLSLSYEDENIVIPVTILKDEKNTQEQEDIKEQTDEAKVQKEKYENKANQIEAEMNKTRDRVEGEIDFRYIIEFSKDWYQLLTEMTDELENALSGQHYETFKKDQSEWDKLQAEKWEEMTADYEKSAYIRTTASATSTEDQRERCYYLIDQYME